MQKLTGLYVTKTNCFQYTIKECDGACIEQYPQKNTTPVQNFIDKNSFENQNMLLIDKGRTISERSVVMIENGIYKGFAFYDLNYQINNVEIRNIIIPMQNNRTQNIIQGHVRRNKTLKNNKI
jgi:DNA polymerase-3 subunit epsilon